MDATEFEEVTHRCTESDDWFRVGCLPGVSTVLGEFEQQLLTVETNATRGIVVFLQRTCLSEPIDTGIARALGFITPEVVELQPYAHSFNESLLFGSGAVPGAIESSEVPLVIRNIDYLSADGHERLCRHISVWMAGSKRKVLLAGRDTDFGELLAMAVAEQAVVVNLHLPPLSQRCEDMPFIIHAEATQHGGGIDHFTLDAVNAFEEHVWSFGAGEVNEVVRGLYVSMLRSESRPTFTRDEVRSIMDRVARVPAASTNSDTRIVDSGTLFAQLKSKIDDIDRLATSLTGQPFFTKDAIPATATPLRSDSPELGFIQIVSWAYVTVVENGEPNLRCVLRLFSGQRLDPARVRQVRDTIVSLRTYLQHSLTYSSDHDQDTLNGTYEWFERTIGRRQPELSDFESCIHSLILDCHALFDDLARFLRSVGKDEFRNVVLEQWKDARERAWPKHKFDNIVDAAIRRLGRTDLDAVVVCNQHLKELQDILAATVSDKDRTTSLEQFIEQRIFEKYPLPMPVGGNDLIALGVQPGPQIGEILGVLRERFAAGQTSRDTLLDIAKKLINDCQK